MARRGGRTTRPLDRARQYYEQRKRRFAARAGKIEDDGYEEAVEVREQVLAASVGSRAAGVVELRNSGEISNEVMHRLERELDLEESYLENSSVVGSQTSCSPAYRACRRCHDGSGLLRLRRSDGSPTCLSQAR